MKVGTALRMVLASAEKHHRVVATRTIAAVVTRIKSPKTKIIKPPPGLVAKMAQYGFKLETMEVVITERPKRPEWKVRVAKRNGKPFVVTVHACSMKQAKQAARMIKGVVRVINAW